MRKNESPEITISLQNGKTYIMDVYEFCEKTNIQYMTLRNALRRGVMPKECKTFGIIEIKYQGFYVTTEYKNIFDDDKD